MPDSDAEREPQSENKGTEETKSQIEELTGLGEIAQLLKQQVGMMREREEREKGGEVFGALFGAGDRVTAFALSQFLPRDFLRERGFTFREAGIERGADYRRPSEFGEGFGGYERWLTAIFGNLWDYELVLDEGVRTFVKGEVVRKRDLSLEEKQRLLSLADGLFFIHNYNLAWLGCNGEMLTFIASPQEGGVVSKNERDRLSYEHLKQQCRLFPGMAQALSLTDAWAAKEKYVPESQKQKDVFPEDYCYGLSAEKLGLSREREWKVNYQKELAMAWYRVGGFLDTRNYQEKHRRYTDLMPRKESELETLDGREKYEQAVNFRRWSARYDSPYTFLMDPLSLLADIQAKFQDIVDNIRVGIRESQSKHNILNLGWRPAAWLMLEKIAGHSLKPEELEGVSLAKIGNKSLADLTDGEWETLFEGVDLQKVNIKNGMKASEAMGAFYKCFTLDPKEFVNLYGAIVSYLRTDDPKKDGIWTKSQVLPVVTRALQEIIESVRGEKIKLLVSKTEMRRILWQIKFLTAPAVPFTRAQENFFVESATDVATVRAVGG